MILWKLLKALSTSAAAWKAPGGGGGAGSGAAGAVRLRNGPGGGGAAGAGGAVPALCEGGGPVPGHEERGLRPGAGKRRPRRQAAGGKGCPGGGLPHPGHGDYPPADCGGKAGSHPEGLPQKVGQNSKRAPLTEIIPEKTVNCKFFLKSVDKVVDGWQIYVILKLYH